MRTRSESFRASSRNYDWEASKELGRIKEADASHLKVIGQDGTTMRPNSIDYQKVADRAGDGDGVREWQTPSLASARGAAPSTRYSPSSAKRQELPFITILLGDREIYAWEGHAHSVFRIVYDRLYYAKFLPGGTGGSIVAVDLASGKELWTSRLTALGPVDHSDYLALLNLDCNGNVVTMYRKRERGEVHRDNGLIRARLSATRYSRRIRQTSRRQEVTQNRNRSWPTSTPRATRSWLRGCGTSSIYQRAVTDGVPQDLPASRQGTLREDEYPQENIQRGAIYCTNFPRYILPRSEPLLSVW